MSKITNIALITAMLSPAAVLAEDSLFNPYGSIRVQLQHTDDGIEFKDNYSRLGAYGSTEIQPGLKATYNVEFRLNLGSGKFAGDKGARLANVGLEGNFGSVLIGKQYSPMWNYTDNAIDIVSDVDESAGCSGDFVCHTHRFGFTTYDAAGNQHYIELLRPDRAVSYQSPDFAGFQFAALAVLNDGSVKANAAGDNEDLVAYNIAAKYKIADITLSASRFDATGLEGDNFVDAFQVAWNKDQLSLAAHYQTSTDRRFYNGAATGEEADEDIMEVFAAYKVGKYTFQATYADISMETQSGIKADTDQTILDVVYKHNKGSFYASYVAWGDEAESVFKAEDKFIIGYRLDL